MQNGINATKTKIESYSIPEAEVSDFFDIAIEEAMDEACIDKNDLLMVSGEEIPPKDKAVTKSILKPCAYVSVSTDIYTHLAKQENSQWRL
ncbi:MAG: hypothetical protein ACJA08_003064 [Cyclobacteriaceae bacterium]